MFTHLHVHSEYSLLDGSAKIKEIIALARQYGMDSIALTDHGVMFGVVDFYKEAVANGVRPILGCEVYVAAGSRFARENFYYHLVLLAENNTGLTNLYKLSSLGFTEGFYYKPRVDLDLLAKYHEGLIALSACMSGPVARTFLNAGYEAALDVALKYNKLFGEGNFFLELQDHGISRQKNINQALIKMSRDHGIPLVCTNDSHYCFPEDARAHEILLCIQTGKTINDSDRMIYEGNQFYIKSPEEMTRLFGHVPEALENTERIARRCNVSIEFNNYKLPEFKLPPDRPDAFAYLKSLCEKGLKRRYGAEAANLSERLEYELDVIASMGFVDYFLITWDFILYAKKNGIPVGPGRGSAAGSVVSYSLGITNIDPIKYGLLFERFLNAERISMPDIDIDFCYDRRQEVIDYVINKYGADHVTQIITFGTMGAKAVIRDVGRALAMPYGAVDRVAKMIPFALDMTIEKALKLNPDLTRAYEEEQETANLIDMAKRLEGLPRHASTHACGVVITNRPVMEYVPLNVNDGVITTQFPMTTIEELGLLKMDFLGLRTLTVISNTVKELKRGSGLDVNIDRISLSDPFVYELISQGRTEGVFQLESSGMKSFMRELSPSRMEDIIAGISLYRPGPMDFIPKYLKGKNDPGSITYDHPALEPILNDTYGCIVYQEQVMSIVRSLAGYSLARADLVRRAMSKKKADVMKRERAGFVDGCLANGVATPVAEKIFDDMTDFAKYAFNKSHAAAYALVGYQTAWLKTHFPVEFMAATMTSVMDSTSKLAEYIDECKRLGISILPPDINESLGAFSVHDGAIRFGLKAIKNVGGNVTDAVIRERDSGLFTSLTEFLSRLSLRDLNKRTTESLIKAGAFDSLGGKRCQYMCAFEPIMAGLASEKKRNLAGQLNLFELDSVGYNLYKDELPRVEEYPLRDLLSMEKEVLGVYVTGHPLSEYSNILERETKQKSGDFSASPGEGISVRLKDNDQVRYGGLISQKTIKYGRQSGKPMAFLTVEDMTGSVEVVVFTDLYEKKKEKLETDAVVIVTGRASVREDEDAKIVASDVRFVGAT
jgi:DNA polymerase-3 subunit alpha